MMRLARSSLTAALAGALLLAPMFTPVGSGAGSGAVTRNVPYGEIAQTGTMAARSAAHARQLATAGHMPYFGVVGAAANTSMDDTMMPGAQQQLTPMSARTANVATLADTNVDSGSGVSTSTWLLGGAAVALALVALAMALQPRWRTERAHRAERERQRMR